MLVELEEILDFRSLVTSLVTQTVPTGVLAVCVLEVRSQEVLFFGRWQKKSFLGLHDDDIDADAGGAVLAHSGCSSSASGIGH